MRHKGADVTRKTRAARRKGAQTRKGAAYPRRNYAQNGKDAARERAQRHGREGVLFLFFRLFSLLSAAAWQVCGGAPQTVGDVVGNR